MLAGPDDLRSPRELHPVFYGSFDWHSCVHGYWLLARLYRRLPDIPTATPIRALLDAQLTPEKVAGERAFLALPHQAGFERPYGWAWLLMLAGELARHRSPEARRWSAAIQPLAGDFVARFHAFLPRATYPVRSGTHSSTAFALALALDYAAAVEDEELGRLLREKAWAWYGRDEDCRPWEPSGEDFLSPTLVEAVCMRRALEGERFGAWIDAFLPRLAGGEPAALFRPATVSDRGDGKIAHLDGLNLSRAWCWRELAGSLPPHDPRRAPALAAAELHLAASLPHLAGEYAGEHWLATFALLAVESPAEVSA